MDETLAPPLWTTADRVRKIRRGTGLTQVAFADRVEVPVGTLKSWESGSSEPKHSDLLLFAVRCQVRFNVPAWWTAGLERPYDLRTDPDPRMRATAEEILGVGALDTLVRPKGLEPPTFWTVVPAAGTWVLAA